MSTTLNNALTAELKRIIQANDLIDTGLMYLSTEVHVRVRQRIEIDIRTPYYYEYLDDKYRLTLSLIESDAMNIFIQQEYEKYMDRYIDKVIRGGVKGVSEYDIWNISLAPVITINGGAADSEAQRVIGDISAT